MESIEQVFITTTRFQALFIVCDRLVLRYKCSQLLFPHLFSEQGMDLLVQLGLLTDMQFSCPTGMTGSYARGKTFDVQIYLAQPSFNIVSSGLCNNTQLELFLFFVKRDSKRKIKP